MADTIDPTLLFVDLDGTLIASDTLWESLLVLLRERPTDVFKLPFWALGCRAAFKRRIAERTAIDPADLPYRQHVLAYLDEQKQQGRLLIMITGADRKIADVVAGHLGIFDEVMASDGKTNCTGHNKLEAIQNRTASEPFDYAGDSFTDLPVWRASRTAILVSPSDALLDKVKSQHETTVVLGDTRPTARCTGQLVRAMRINHWAKNLFLAVPLLVGLQAHDVGKVVAFLFAFVAFGMCASSGYVLNDLLDLQTDSKHALKRFRPFASGALRIATGLVVAAALLVIAAAIALLLPWSFVGWLAVYAALATGYSVCLKRKAIVDVLVVAGLYILRIVSGGAATDVVIGPWLLAISVFLFVGWAFMKRRADLSERA